MRIHEITLTAPAPEELRAFYNVLGFQEIEGLGGSDGYSFKAGFTRVNFIPGDQQARYHFAFNIRPDQLENAYEWTQKLRMDILPHPQTKQYFVDFPNWKARSLYFFDAAGNIVELIARAAITKAGNAPAFSAASILGISEIGITCDDVPSMREWISNTHGVPSFERQVNRDDFSAMGDDEGLLLLVPQGRKWFMGDFDSKRFPIALTGISGGREVRLILP
jgi:catechol 2,3-dioxygenase-like lactoylglutathione lyase family enzyme